MMIANHSFETAREAYIAGVVWEADAGVVGVACLPAAALAEETLLP